MDYKKKYEDAVSKIKSIIADKKKQGLTNCLFEGDLNEIFSEPEASEDDKMRNALIDGLYDCMADDLRWTDFGGIPIKDLLAWLEKQGEQKPAKCIEEEFDDFFNLESVIDIVEMYGKGEAPLYGDDVTSELEWLKSFRDRVYWKPAEEQMSCFKQAIDLFKIKVNDDLVLRILNSLYNDLKKL